MKTESKLVVIFSGYNQRAVISFLRVLTFHNVPFGIISKGKSDTIYDTDYSSKVLVERKHQELNVDYFQSLLNSIRKKIVVQTLFIAPTTEAINRFFLENRNIFLKANCEIPLVDKELYYNISNKKSFTKICSSFGIDIPEELNNIENATYPFVAKPKIYDIDQSKHLIPQIIKNKEDAVCFFKDYNANDFFFQEYIDGKSYYLLYYIDKKKSIYKYSQENLIQQADGKSMVYCKSSHIHFHEISTRFEKMLVELNFRGLIMIEIKGNNGEFKMIEANPRFWGPSQLFVDANADLFSCLLKDYKILSQEFSFDNEPNDVLYSWVGGIKANQLQDKKLKYYGSNSLVSNNVLEELKEHDIYNKKDTIRIFEEEIMNKNEKLIDLYNKTSKHSNYQILAKRLQSIIEEKSLSITSRFEKERLQFLKQHLDFTDKNCLDIGGNTGYFSFELLDLGASNVTHFEGNSNHSNFVLEAAKVLSVEDRLKVINDFYQFTDEDKGNYDVILVFNVLHHLGDDFGDSELSISNAKIEMINGINNLASKCDILVFQMGFCWKGNRELLLFENGTKQEMIDFILSGIKEKWEVISVGIAEENDKGIEYFEKSDSNIERMDSMGEFLNRPIFLLKSKL